MSEARGGSNISGSQACAACKYQRRKCAPNCPLAPYFPPDKQKQFLNAHKLFGVSNITKILRNLHPHEQEIAMKSMIFQANVRDNDPVGGCHRLLCELQRQIHHDEAELEFVLHHLSICRTQAARAQIHMQEPNNVDSLSTYTDYRQPLQQQQLQYDCGSGKVDIEASVDECEDIKPLFGMFDERQPVSLHSKESIQCSDKIVLKEDAAPIQHEQEHDLKGAASLFPLTNRNGYLL